MGTKFSDVYLSTNNNYNWLNMNNGLPANTSIGSIGISGNSIFLSTDNVAYLSTDSGTSWAATKTGFPTNSIVRTIADAIMDRLAVNAHRFELKESLRKKK